MSEHDWRENFTKPIDQNSIDFIREDARHRLGECIEKAQLPQMHDIRESRLVAAIDADREALRAATERIERLERALAPVKRAIDLRLSLIDNPSVPYDAPPDEERDVVLGITLAECRRAAAALSPQEPA